MKKKFVFYWTEGNDTAKGFKVYTETEKERDALLTHYFEASIAPLEDVRYPRKAILFPGVISRR